MEKKLIALELPCLGERYDMFIPMDFQIAELLKLLSSAAVSLSEGRFSPSGEELLCFPKTREVLDPLLTLEDYEIGNGDHLMLF